jgi:hypothetical protein
MNGLASNVQDEVAGNNGWQMNINREVAGIEGLVSDVKLQPENVPPQPEN